MSEQQSILEADLHGYLDGLLDGERSQAVATYLSEHPEEAQRLEEYRRINLMLEGAYDPVLDEPVPQALQVAAGGRHKRQWRVAAAVGWVLLGSVLGWFANSGLESEPPLASVQQKLMAPALAAHAVYTPEVLHPVEVTAEQEQHLVGWLSKRLGTRVKAPALGPLGYQLIGGRLLPGDGGAAAQFMYEAKDGIRLTLYVRRVNWASRETAFRFSEQGETGQFYWIDGELGYALVGNLPRERLLQAAQQVYHDLNL